MPQYYNTLHMKKMYGWSFTWISGTFLMVSVHRKQQHHSGPSHDNLKHTKQKNVFISRPVCVRFVVCSLAHTHKRKSFESDPEIVRSRISYLQMFELKWRMRSHERHLLDYTGFVHAYAHVFKLIVRNIWAMLKGTERIHE